MSQHDSRIRSADIEPLAKGTGAFSSTRFSRAAPQETCNAVTKGALRSDNVIINWVGAAAIAAREASRNRTRRPD
jgi:hypothetical protein